MDLLLFQIVAVLVVTLSFGRLARRLGQASVIGEILGGIALGPSLFGRFFPQLFAKLFPKASLEPFEILTTIGLIIFLFIIGTELNLGQLYQHRLTVVIIGSTSILFPFAIGAVLAGPLSVRFAPHGTSSLSFVLFLGISMSITAFPVLARILEERNLLGSALGTTAIFCAVVGDVVAWLLLALAVATTRAKESGLTSLALPLLMLLAYLSIMLGVVRPLALRFARKRGGSAISIEILGLTLVGAFASAAATTAIGVHPLFGAFLAGVCLPRNHQWQRSLRARLETVVSIFLLPLFFALTGMRTRIDLLNSATIWLWLAIILTTAVAGKMGGAALAARWMGWSWTNAFSLGALLNTRGLVELVVLSVAYDVGVFSPTLFTMLVTMTLITTVSTTPILDLLYSRRNES